MSDVNSSSPRRTRLKSKLFNDSVHGHFELHPLLCRVVDTPEFQRLRDLRQLGGVSYVFATGNHSRFEHSIGVSYLATCFIRRLQKQHPELAISEREVLIIGLAGLCHDLGHGMLSHMFGSAFIRGIHGSDCEWEHEHASAAMLRYLVDANGLAPIFTRFGLDPIDDVHIAQELIFGDEDEVPAGWEWRGLPNSRAFLFDIVANKMSGVDVDKFDYFMRDSRNLGIPITFDCHRLIKSARVARVATASAAGGGGGGGGDDDDDDDDDAPLHICFLEKELWDVHELFHTRFTLHKRAYQHRVARIVEIMLCEAMRAADPWVKVPLLNAAGCTSASARACVSAVPQLVKPKDRPLCATCAAAQTLAERAQRECATSDGASASASTCRLSQSIRSMPAYSCTSDWLIKRIEHSSEAELASARAILRRIRTRDLYPFVADTLLPRETTVAPQHAALTAAIVKEAVALRRARWTLADGPVFVSGAIAREVADAIVLDTVKISYGKGGLDPVRHVGFVGKYQRRASRISESKRASHMTPSCFEERYVRVYVKNKAMRRLVLDAWVNVCAQREWSPPTPGTSARVAEADEGGAAAGNSPAPRRAAAAAAAGGVVRSLGAISPPLALGKRERCGGDGKAVGERDAKRG